MAEVCKIEWTDASWNCITGCTKVSAGCQNCYAEVMAERLKESGSSRYRNGFEVTCHENILNEPLKWKKPKKIFVNSMSDMFHKDVPEEFIFKIFDVMNKCPHHIFQILTKRPERVIEMDKRLAWAPNIWMGTSIENQAVIDRAQLIGLSSAEIRFLSIEPLIGPVVLGSKILESIEWVIVGGESGPNARPISTDWVIALRDECQVAGIPFFFKQWGGKNKKDNGRILEGETYSEFPSQSLFQSKF